MPQPAVRSAARRKSRISLRATGEERQLIEQAALLASSGDVTRFVMRASLQAAQEVVERHHVTQVTEENRRALYSLLLNPPPPGRVLKKLAAKPVPDDVELIET